MKRIVVTLLGLGLVLTSCQQKDILPTSGDESSTVHITVCASDAISVRSGDSAAGGITNVTGLSLRYILAVYDEDGETQIEEPQTKVTAIDEPADFQLVLTDGQTYKFVVWADFVQTPEEDADAADYHYDTDKFPEISYKGTPAINDESFDAYFASEVQTVKSSSLSLSLGRPFAKLRLVATDWDESDASKAITLTYDEGSVYTKFNALTGVASEPESSPSHTGSIADSNPYDDGMDATSGTRTIAVDYLFADTTAETVSISYSVGDDFTPVFSDYQVQICRNYLTTVSGPLLHGGSASASQQSIVSLDRN